MADLPSDRGSTPGTPRWVKVFGVIALIVVVLLVVVILFGAEHDPRRHAGPPSGFELVERAQAS